MYSQLLRHTEEPARSLVTPKQKKCIYLCGPYLIGVQNTRGSSLHRPMTAFIFCTLSVSCTDLLLLSQTSWFPAMHQVLAVLADRPQSHNASYTPGTCHNIHLTREEVCNALLQEIACCMNSVLYHGIHIHLESEMRTSCFMCASAIQAGHMWHAYWFAKFFNGILCSHTIIYLRWRPHTPHNVYYKETKLYLIRSIMGSKNNDITQRESIPGWPSADPPTYDKHDYPKARRQLRENIPAREHAWDRKAAGKKAMMKVDNIRPHWCPHVKSTALEPVQ